jgi:hypothetical protein
LRLVAAAAAARFLGGIIPRKESYLFFLKMRNI